MIQFFKGKLILVALTVYTLVFTACDKDMSVFLDRNSNDALSVSIIDSFTVATSTYQLAYLPTAASRVLLVGKANQPEIGSVKSTAYFELSIQDVEGIPTDAIFDSVNMVLKPHSSNYYYGDTTLSNTFKVHKLTEKIQTQNITSNIIGDAAPFYVTGPTIFNKTKFTYDAIPLGSVSFIPKVKSMDSLAIRLDQNFGSTIFDLMRTNGLQTINYDTFLDYINGIALVPDDNNKAIIAFNDSVEVRFNYSFINASGFKTKGYKSLTLGNPARQYNNIEYNRSGTPFNGLGTVKKELSLSETNGQLMIQAGTGVVSKIGLKSLENLMREQNIAVNKAELVIETTSSINGLYPAPTRLMLMIADGDGNPVSYLTGTSSQFGGNSILFSYFTLGNQTGKNNTYTFDLIQYSKFITTQAFNNTSLFLTAEIPTTSSTGNTQATATPPNLFNSTSAVIIATENNVPKIKLNIVYTKFQ